MSTGFGEAASHITVRIGSPKRPFRRNAAAAFIQRLEEQIGALEVFPERCPLVPENEFLGTAYRHLLFGNYRTVFKIISARVIILRVLHGSRLLDTELLEG